MDCEIKGIPEIEKELEKKFGKTAMRGKSDRALIVSSEFMLKSLKTSFVSFKDTGASIDEMKRTEPFTAKHDNLRTILIEWVGPKDRYKLIHLNEHGYERNGVKYTPRGFGVIAKTLQATKAMYKEIALNELRKSL